MRILILLTLVSTLGLVACEDGPAERAGESLDNLASDARDTVEDAATDAGNAVEDACEEVRQENC